MKDCKIMKKTETSSWEQTQINNLTLQMIFAATLGTLAAAAISYILRTAQIGEIRPELLFIPWGIALVFGVSLGFRRGVMAERARQDKLQSPAAEKAD